MHTKYNYIVVAGHLNFRTQHFIKVKETVEYVRRLEINKGPNQRIVSILGYCIPLTKVVHDMKKTILVNIRLILDCSFYCE